jgi:hypothetical protein
MNKKLAVLLLVSTCGNAMRQPSGIGNALRNVGTKHSVYHCGDQILQGTLREGVHYLAQELDIPDSWWVRFLAAALAAPISKLFIRESERLTKQQQQTEEIKRPWRAYGRAAIGGLATEGSEMALRGIGTWCASQLGLTQRPEWLQNKWGRVLCKAVEKTAVATLRAYTQVATETLLLASTT